MTDKERLEEIERQLNRAEIKRENLDIEDFQNIIEQQLINGNLTWLVQQNKRYREAIKKGINATRYTNPEVAYILAEALEGEE